MELLASAVVLLIPATITTTLVYLVTDGTSKEHWPLYSIAFWVVMAVLLSTAV